MESHALIIPHACSRAPRRPSDMPFRRTVLFFHHANARKGAVIRTLAADSKRSFWAMADQGAVSLGNFGVNVALAKSFASAGDLPSYGAYWVLMELMLFLLGLQGALVV